MKKISVLLTGGGSGGHIYTLLAVAQKLKQQSAAAGVELDLRYFGDPGNYALLLAAEGVRVAHVTSSKLRRYFSLRNFVDFIKFAWSIPQALWKIFWFMPDVAFSKGGPGAIPIINACAFYRVPIVIHDSDAVPGLTSKVTGRVAKIIELAFASAGQYIENRAKVHVVGNPVRDELLLPDTLKTPQAAMQAKFELNFDRNIPLIVFLGGSQGSGRINAFVLENLKLFIGKYQVLHQIGVQNFDTYAEEYHETAKTLTDDERLRYRPVAFLEHDMRLALTAADLIVSRAGAGAIFEIAAAEKPSILIPLPNSANDHQKENAFQYEDAGACLIIEEENLIGNLFLREVDGILANPEKLKKMRESAKNFYKPNAAETIAKDIINLTT